MISLIKKLPEIKDKNTAYAKIACHFAAYGEYEKIALFWQQTDDSGRITALISSVDNVFTLYFSGGDTDEMKEFLRAISPKGIFTDTNTAELLELKTDTNCYCLKKTPPHSLESAAENTYAGIDYLCDTLSKRLDIGDKTALKADISHRLRHNCAAYVTTDYSAGAIIYAGECAVINGIATVSEKSGSGIGSATLKRLIQSVRQRTVFVCAEEKNVPFYEKNGFIIDGTAAYCRL